VTLITRIQILLLLLLSSLIINTGCYISTQRNDYSYGGYDDGYEEGSVDVLSDDIESVEEVISDELIECIPYTELDGGECNIVRQCGCPTGQWCTWEYDLVECGLKEVCTSRSAGTVMPGMECNYFSNNCEPGSQCAWSGYGSEQVCYEWCIEDTDCSNEGTTCSRLPTAELVPFCGSDPGPRFELVPYLICS
jgi:hypothetical protein